MSLVGYYKCNLFLHPGFASLIPLTLCNMQVQDVMKPIQCADVRGGEGRDAMGCKQLSYGQ